VALLVYPDFFKVAVSATGNHDIAFITVGGAKNIMVLKKLFLPRAIPLLNMQLIKTQIWLKT
jgi:hypothetical protein